MFKELIGAVATFFVMLPFLLSNLRIFKIKEQSKFAFMFLLINTLQGAFLFLLAYGLFTVGQRCLFGMLIVFTVFLFLTLIILIKSKRKITSKEYDEYDDEDDEEELFDEDLYQTQKIARDQKIKVDIKKEMEDREEQILEENQYTMNVGENDFNISENDEVIKTLEDIFKEK